MNRAIPWTVAGFLLYRELRTRPSRVAESISRKDAADAKGSIAKKAFVSIAFFSAVREAGPDRGGHREGLPGVLCRPLSRASDLDVEIECKLVRMRSQANGIYFVLAFVREPGVDDVRRENVSFQKEVVI
jgi:hypothetical protein